MAKCIFFTDATFKLVNWKQIIVEFNKNNTDQLRELIKDLLEILNGLMKDLL